MYRRTTAVSSRELWSTMLDPKLGCCCYRYRGVETQEEQTEIAPLRMYRPAPTWTLCHLPGSQWLMATISSDMFRCAGRAWMMPVASWLQPSRVQGRRPKSQERL